MSNGERFALWYFVILIFGAMLLGCATRREVKFLNDLEDNVNAIVPNVYCSPSIEHRLFILREMIRDRRREIDK